MTISTMTIRPLLLLATLAVASSTFCSSPDHDHGPGELNYVQNMGQWPDNVLYRVNFPGASMFLEPDGIFWVRLEDGAGDRFHDASNDPMSDVKDLSFLAHAWKIAFVGADPAPRTSGAEKTTFYHNYFLGDDPSRWAGNVPVYREIVYHDLWPGVDLHWHGSEGNVKYDLVLGTGADVRQIGFRYDGLEVPVQIVNNELVVTTAVGTYKEARPVAWYTDDRSPVRCEYRLKDGQIGFHFPKGYDKNRQVVIDPLLIGATYSGVVNNDIYGHCATYDNDGNIYSSGQSFGPGLPTTPGVFQATFGGGFSTDIAVNKFSPDATAQIWATYIGGNSDEKPHSMIANAAQELTVFGSCTGTGYPTTAGAYSPTFNGGSSDIVVTRLNAAATALIGSTYMGGNGADGRQNFTMTINYGDTYRGEVMLDAANNTFVASCTESANFPTSAGAYQSALSGAQDGVVFGLSPDCSSIIWSSYIGGTTADNALGLRFNSAGDLYVCGGTTSVDFPNLGNGWQNTYQGGDKDGYLVKFTNNGTTLANATFFGTAGEDVANFVELDFDEDVYIFGQSDGGVAITPPGTYGQAGGNIFVAQFDPPLASTIFTTALGPVGGFGYSLAPVAFLVDVCDHIYISGYNPDTWATTPDALYGPGFSQFYLAAYDVDMAGLLFGSYYGGSHVDGGTSRFDKNGIIYQGVCSGGNSMPTSAGAFAPTNNVGWDIGVFKIDFQVAGVGAAGAGVLNQGCAPIQIDFVNNSTGNQWLWDFGDGSPPVSAFEPSYTYTAPGVYTVTLIAMDSLSCNLADTITFPITIGQAQVLTAAFTAAPTVNCNTFEVSTTNNSTGTPLDFDWDMGDGTQYTDTNVVHNYAGPGLYDITLIVSDPTGCSPSDTMVQSINVPPPNYVVAGFAVTQQPDCDDLIVNCTNTTAGFTPTYTWDMGDGATYNTTNVNHTYSAVGTYTITMIVTDSATCNINDTTTAQITVDPLDPVFASFTIDQVFDCDSMIAVGTNTSAGDSLVFLWDMGDGTTLTDTNAVHAYTTPGTYNILLIVADAFGCMPPDSATAQVTLDPIIPVVADMVVGQVNDCGLLEVEGTNLSTGDSVMYFWDMGDGTVLNDTNVTYSYANAGNYTITLTVMDLGCGNNDQISFPVSMIDELPVDLGPDPALCVGEVVVLNATTPSANTYTWNTGEMGPFITVTTPGLYSVTVTDANCIGMDTVEVIQGQLYDLGYELEACPDAQLTLSIPLAGTNYAWNTGGTQQNEVVFGPGIYYFSMLDQLGCPQQDTIIVHALDAEAQLFAPNAFTPDGDGINDEFLIKGHGELFVEMTVFNRWGEQIYKTNTLSRPWNGKVDGTLAQQGVYVYELKYNSYCEPGKVTSSIGHVTVVR